MKNLKPKYPDFVKYFQATYLGKAKSPPRYSPASWAFFGHNCDQSPDFGDPQRTNNIAESNNKAIKDFLGTLGLGT